MCDSLLFRNEDLYNQHINTREHRQQVDTFMATDVSCNANNNNNDNKYGCFLCDMQFANSQSCAIHKRSIVHQHNEEQFTNTSIYTCSKCDKECNNLFNLKLHLKHKHGHNRITCQLCNVAFNSHLEYSTHMQSAQHRDLHTCQQCNIDCGNAFNYHNHLTSIKHAVKEQQQQQQTFECRICNVTCHNNKYNYDAHLQSKRHYAMLNKASGKKKAEPPSGSNVASTSCNTKYNYAVHSSSHITGSACVVVNNTNIRKQFSCNICKRQFSSVFLLHKHCKLHAKPYACSECNEAFIYKKSLLRHKQREHRMARKKTTTNPLSCFNCNATFTNRVSMNKHLKQDCNARCIPSVDYLLQPPTLMQWSTDSALRGCISVVTAKPKLLVNNEKVFFDDTIPAIRDVLHFLHNSNVSVKWSYALDVTFSKTAADGSTQIVNASFFCKRYAFDNSNVDEINDNICTMTTDIISSIDKFCTNGSQFTLKSIDKFDLHLYRVNLQRGGAKVNLPPILKGKRCVINIDSDQCFKFAVLSALHHRDINMSNRAEEYTQWENEYQFPPFPMVSAANVQQFGKAVNLAIYTHVWNEKQQIAECTFRPPVQISSKYPRIHLLLYAQHWMAVTDLSRLYSTGTRPIHMCDLCLAKFSNYNRFVQHLPCKPAKYTQNEIMPKCPILKFSEHNKCVALADVVYADLEAILQNVQGGGGGNMSNILQEHVPCCVGAYYVSKVEQSTYSEFTGKECMQLFVQYLDALCHRLWERNKTSTRKPADKTDEEMMHHHAAKQCIWCKETFDSCDNKKKKVFDHDHLTGKYVGAACYTCNFKRKQDRNTLAVVFHNFKGYDSHALCLQGLSKLPHWELRPIALNPEKYLALFANLRIDKSKGRAASFRIRFIDSLQLMPSSLATLVGNLVGANKDYSKLQHSSRMLETYTNLEPNDICAKGIFPYSYVSSWEKLKEERLPPLQDFYDVLEEDITVTEEEYRRAQKMFIAFGCCNIYDYQLRYLELDCRLLADVFEQFRHVIMNEDKFDPIHFLTISQLSYSSALKSANTSIGLITEEEMYRDVERCKRGGYAFVNKHYCKASNPYVNPGAEHTKQDIYLGNVDANNLYGNALRYPLPVGEFQYLTEDEFTSINWKTVDTNGQYGYFVVCDLLYPIDIHSSTCDLPLAPEVAEIKYDDFTPYMKSLHEQRNLKYNPQCKHPDRYQATTKLVAKCTDKLEYVVHFLVLQLYLKLGMQLGTVHRVIKFRQAPIFRDYIDFNTARRAAASNEFEKNLYKQKNCSLFGKSLENKRNRCDITLCNSHHKMINVASNHRFMHARVFSPTLSAACLTKHNVELDAPIAIGVSVLDISKYIMYKLAYEKLAHYESAFDCKINIVGGDTDSFFIEVIGADLIGVLYPQMAVDGLLDTSNYPNTHALFSNAHKAELDCIKDEFCGVPYSEFVLLRPKSYSMLSCSDNTSKRKCKGIVKRKVQAFSHNDYKKTWQLQTEMGAHCRRMQSKLHVVYNIDQYKIALSYTDDKRCWFSNNFSLPYGHCAYYFHIVFPPRDVIINHEQPDECLPIKRAKH